MKIKSPSREEWVDILNKCPEATFFATPEWIEIVEKTYGYANCTKLFVFEDGQKVLCPLVRTNKVYGIFSQYLSVPFHNYGGFLSKNLLDKSTIQSIIKKLSWGKDNYILCFHPFVDNKEFNIVNFTHLLDLRNGYEYISQHIYEPACRNKIRKAEKSNIKIKIADSENDIKKYFAVYLDSLQRWGRTDGYPLNFYLNLFKYSPEKVQIWIAEYEGNVIAGVMNVVFNKYLYNMFSAVMKEYMNLGVVNLLHDRAGKWACDKKISFYDFGSSNADGKILEGVIEFKESFGAKKVFLRGLSIKSKLVEMLVQIKRRIIK